MARDCQVWTQATTAAPDAQGPQSTHRMPWSPVEALGVADPLRSWGMEIHGLLATNYTFNLTSLLRVRTGSSNESQARPFRSRPRQRATPANSRKWTGVRYRPGLWQDRRSYRAGHALVQQPTLRGEPELF